MNAAPRVVGPGSDIRTANVPWRQVLIYMTELAAGTPRYWVHFLLARVSEARWITCDPYFKTEVDGKLENSTSCERAAEP